MLKIKNFNVVDEKEEKNKKIKVKKYCINKICGVLQILR